MYKRTYSRVQNFIIIGIDITFTSLTWEPFMKLENCKENGYDCENNGILVDLMNAWSRVGNFTWKIYKDVNDDWGLKPNSGISFQSPNKDKIRQDKTR